MGRKAQFWSGFFTFVCLPALRVLSQTLTHTLTHSFSFTHTLSKRTHPVHVCACE